MWTITVTSLLTIWITSILAFRYIQISLLVFFHKGEMSISLILTKISILHQATNLSGTNRVCLFVFYLSNSSPMSTHKSNVSKRWLVLLLTIDWMVLSYGKEVSNYGKDRSQLLRLSIEQNRSSHRLWGGWEAMWGYDISYVKR